MKTKTIPAIIMLTAGAIACVAGIIGHISTVEFTKMLLTVLVVFYIFGCIVKMIIDSNFKEMQKEETTEGEDASDDENSVEAGEENVEEQEKTKQ